MENEDRPIAFVAMKFSDIHYRDRRYQAIRDVLESAGFACVRGDSIQTSGSVVDEVCRYLRDAQLVVFDCSDDSHNVSYEIGYCHGVKRSPETTLLLSSSADVPFNYRHFRVRQYKDTRALRRVLRDFLQMSEPLRRDQYGYVFAFTRSEVNTVGYILDALEYVLDSFVARKFSGRLECYSGDLYSGERYFAVAIVARQSLNGKTPEYGYWEQIYDDVEKRCGRSEGALVLQFNGSELAEKSGVARDLMAAGVVEMKRGKILRSIDAHEEETLVDMYLQRKAAQRR